MTGLRKKTNPWQVSDRVQDKDGFTGTVTARWPIIDSDQTGVEVTWDISGCCSDLSPKAVERMKPGQDAKDVQAAIHAKLFPEDFE